MATVIEFVTPLPLALQAMNNHRALEYWHDCKGEADAAEHHCRQARRYEQQVRADVHKLLPEGVTLDALVAAFS
ncbi:hypothetical protein PX699_13495 [Sphingobium sp. H39-3-25]|uniref:hypothetical protein n=1 Tax=Sphingobium arseniciresistens TaxID=3030834 RepID=UPI0023B92DE8|nr:hypothetical protein [Sphingobium arseniciresistens]